MSAIFISHSSKDNAIAGEIKAKLAQQGHRSVFLDFDPEVGIPAGRNWEKELYARLRGCQAVIVLCSEHSMASSWCFAEITQARSLGKHLFPLKIAACQISSLLSDVQVTDLTLNPTEGYQRLWSGLKKVGLNPADLFDWDGTRSPYPGLLAFQEQDAAVYFGRDAAIQGTMETLNRLQRLGGSRLVLVLGASGSGKSSLVRAGVIPRLKRDKDRWLVLEPFRPLGRPFDELAMLLGGAFAAFGSARDWKSIREVLNPADTAGGAHLLDLANDLRVAAGRREATVLLVVDQFEELLGRATDPSAGLFFRLLRAILSQPSSPFLAVATLRSDFLGAFQTHEAVQDLLYEPLPLPQMALADFAQVIEGPAKVAGVELEAGLAQAMVADTTTDDALPLLAFTLRELWDRYSGDGRLTLEEYRDRLGGLQGSLARAAEAIFAERTLSADEELHLRKAFLTMVRVDEEGRYVRKPAPWKELPEDVHDLLERFVQARLLVSRSEGVERILEVAHEALFRSWDRLVAWLNADREFLLWRQRLGGDMAEWERNEHDENMLLRGPVLAEAERWLGERPDDLDSAEREFIEASVALQEQERAARERLRRRNRIIALAVIGIVSIAALFAGWQWWRAEEQRYLAEESEKRQSYRRGILLADTELREDSPIRARESLDASPKSLRHWEWYYLYSLLRPPEQSLRGHSGDVTVVAWNNNGTIIASGGKDGTVRLWNAANGTVLHVFDQYFADIRDVRFSPDGELLAARGLTRDGKSSSDTIIWNVANATQRFHFSSAAVFSPDSTKLALVTGQRGEDGDLSIHILDIASGKILRTLPGKSRPAFSPDGKLLAALSNRAQHQTAAESGPVAVWNIETGSEVLSLPKGDRAHFSFDGKRILTEVADMTEAWLWDPTTRRELAYLRVSTDYDRSIVFSPDSNQFVFDFDDTVTVWDAEDAQRISNFRKIAERGYVTYRSVVFGNKGLIASVPWKGSVKIWDLHTNQDIVTLHGHDGLVNQAVFSPDGKQLATAGSDGVIKIWNVAIPYRGHTRKYAMDRGEVNSVAFSPDAKVLASASSDGTVRLLASDGTEERTLRGSTASISSYQNQSGAIYCVQFSPDGKKIATAAGLDFRSEVDLEMWGEVRLWDATTGESTILPLEPRSAQAPHTGMGVRSIAFSRDGRTLAYGTPGNSVIIYDIQRAAQTLTLEGHEKKVLSIEFSPDGNWIVSGSADGTSRLWNAATGVAIRTFARDGSAVNGVAFCCDGKRIVTGGQDGYIGIWDISTAELLHELRGHTKAVLAVAVSPDGRRIASVSADKTLKLWDAVYGEDLLTLRGHSQAITSVAFSPDGKRIATGSSLSTEEGETRIWDASTGWLRASPGQVVTKIIGAGVN